MARARGLDAELIQKRKAVCWLTEDGDQREKWVEFPTSKKFTALGFLAVPSVRRERSVCRRRRLIHQPRPSWASERASHRHDVGAR